MYLCFYFVESDDNRGHFEFEDPINKACVTNAHHPINFSQYMYMEKEEITLPDIPLQTSPITKVMHSNTSPVTKVMRSNTSNFLQEQMAKLGKLQECVIPIFYCSEHGSVPSHSEMRWDQHVKMCK